MDVPRPFAEARMRNIMVGRPDFNDWANAMDRVAAQSRGTLHVRDLDDLEQVVSYARRFRMEAIIPSTYRQMELIARGHDRFAAFGCRVVCSESYDVIADFDDKGRFIQFMDDQALMHLLPEVYVVQRAGVRTDYAPIRYPCIFKLAVSFGGAGATVHPSASRPPDLAKVPRTTDYVVQAFIPGNTEYGGHFLLAHGRVVRALYYRNTRDPSVQVQRGRMLTYDRLEALPEADQLEDLFARVNYTGFACVDFKIVDGQVQIFEINPRLGGTLMHNIPDLLDFFAAVFAD